MQNVQDSHVRNFDLAQTDEFAAWMIGTIREEACDIFRIHVVGDYFSESYIQDWQTIVSRHPRTIFYSYSRTWAVPDMREELFALGRMPNMRLWLSWDRSMPKPPSGFRNCYLMKDDNDVPDRPADLMFRDQVTGVMKFAGNGSWVCPYENGALRSNGKNTTTCTHCRFCWETKGRRVKPKPMYQLETL